MVLAMKYFDMKKVEMYVLDSLIDGAKVSDVLNRIDRIAGHDKSYYFGVYIDSGENKLLDFPKRTPDKCAALIALGNNAGDVNAKTLNGVTNATFRYLMYKALEQLHAKGVE